MFIVEGDSAGGSAKQGRNNQTQAVLPLRGKILNSEGLPLDKVLTNVELNDLVSAIGTGAGEKFDINGLRYGKIILLMDADADGHHITTLMLAFFFRHMTGIDPQGPRLSGAAAAVSHRCRQGEVLGARRRHREEILAGLRANAKPEVSRFKGLGEMDPKELERDDARSALPHLVASADRLQLRSRIGIRGAIGQRSVRTKFILESWAWRSRMN